MDKELQEKITAARNKIKLCKDETVIRELSDLLFSAGKIAAAVNVFELAIEPNQNSALNVHPEELGKQGRAFFERGLEFADGYLFEDAVHCLLKALTLGYETFESHYCLAGVYKSLENWDAAERHCRFSLALRENFLPTHLLLASLLKRKGQYGLCVELCQKSLHIDTDCAIAYYDLACYQALLNNPEAALEALENALLKGFTDYEHFLRDPDFESLWENPRFLLLLKLHQIKIS